MKKINNIDDINPTFKNFEFGWDESYSYGKTALEKYANKIISFRITEKSCYILLQSKIKFFGFKFILEQKKIKRINDKKMNIFTKYKGVVLNKKGFKSFERILILSNL